MKTKKVIAELLALEGRTGADGSPMKERVVSLLITSIDELLRVKKERRIYTPAGFLRLLKDYNDQWNVVLEALIAAGVSDHDLDAFLRVYCGMRKFPDDVVQELVDIIHSPTRMRNLDSALGVKFL